ncbi:SEC14 cytosolic factor family protein / phosphoglyceride transfer family protein [Wolffia australiana]
MADESDALFRLLDELEPFKLQGHDKRGRRILRIVGKFFPGRIVEAADLMRYLEAKIFPHLNGKNGGFVIVYMHSCVQRIENFPGVSVLRSIYESLPPDVRGSLEAVFFVHPGLQSRLFFATFGRFLFSSGLYGKLRYVSRLEFLWESIRRGEVEVPELVADHDEELERRPLMDYGVESDHQHRRPYDAPAMDSASSMRSLRCIS